MKILICGATGYVGSRLTKKLLDEGHQIRCLARNPDSLNERFNSQKLEVIHGNLLNQETLHHIFDDIEVAYYLVHSLTAKDNFQDKEALCAKNFINEAKKSDVKRIIYLGGLGTNSEDLSPHLESRKEVGQILKSSQIPCIEIQASIIIGSGSLSFEIMKHLVERLPLMITPKWVSSMAQPIWIDDVLRYLTESILIKLSGSCVIQIGGPDQITYKELMSIYAKILGKKRLMISVPVLTPNLSSKWLGLVTPVYARVGKKLIESLKSDSIIENNDHINQFSVTPIGIRESLIKTTSDLNQNVQPESRWYDSISSGISEFNLNDQTKYKHRYKDVRKIAVPVDPITAFNPINQIGGKNGWYFANLLWNIRGWIDLIVGGVGLRRRNRINLEKFIVGDTLDWWRISESKENQYVRLEAEMKLPGKAWLEFRVWSDSKGSILQQTAGFDTNSIFGQIYWVGLLPLHKVIFQGMINQIAKKIYNPNL